MLISVNIEQEIAIRDQVVNMNMRATFFSLALAGFLMGTGNAQSQTQAAAEAGVVQSQQSLDQAQKELLAQEEMLLKQVGEVAPAVVPPQAETKPAQSPELTAPVKKSEPVTQTPEAPVKGTNNIAKVSVKSAPSELCDGQDLANAKARIKKLTAELDEARNRLMISETEVERLAHLIDERNRGSTRMASKAVSAPRASLASNGMRVREPSEIQAKAESDMPIATVITEKAQLRTGPGKDNSPLMTVSQGTRLAIETRTGDWYRVISPTGTRAWVSSDVIDFGESTRPDSALRGKGLTSSRDAEDAAFEAISRGVKK